MLLILGLVYIFHSTIQAASAPVSESLLLNTSPPALTSPTQCLCPGQQRSLWDILWSCLATIFACTWVSVHPNIPPPEEKWWKTGLRRLELMCWALIAPELIMLWAMRQWQGARILAKKYRRHRWTKTHGYFVQMGGFTLVKGEESQGVLTPRKMEDLLKKGVIELPRITEEEIRDRSKGDGLSKALVIGQTSWFVAQCAARQAQGLMLTELELVTGAFAVLNGIMYFLWWNKPLDVRCSVQVHLLGTAKKPFQFESTQKSEFALRDAMLTLLRTAYRRSTRSLASSLTWIRKSITRFSLNALQKAVLIIVISPWTAISALFSRLNDICAPDNMPERVGLASAVPTFHASTADPSGMTRLQILAVISGIAALFGGIHCAGWYLIFPSHTELVIWRICSAVIAIFPLITLFAFMTAFFSGSAKSESVKKLLGPIRIIGSTLLAITVLCLPAYVVARLLLLAEAFASLRYLPPAAREIVNWMAFAPHI